ncbi:MAG: hypothetical protein L6R37_000540 [Teloschistes peruensis]|nr:MAG: hypothetical protein L6R37_000540 [Teloschistes peruensis]
MDFAPYQDTAPERTRALSPPPPPTNQNPPSPSRTTLPPPHHFTDEPDDLGARGGSSGATGTGTGGGLGGGNNNHMDLFTTSLPLRLDHEACLAYLCLPPAGGVALLILEHKSDYVRSAAFTPFPRPPAHFFGTLVEVRSALKVSGKTQVPRLAIESGVHGAVYRAPCVFVVEGVVVDAAGGEFGAHCFFDRACVSGW